MQSVEKKCRDVTLDVAKGVLIFLVVWAHSIQFGFGYEYGEAYYCYDDYIFRVIYSFHMPLFMAISGYLYYWSNKRSFKDVMVKRFKSIAVPYLAYCTVMVFVLLPTAIWGEQNLDTVLSTYKNGFWFLPSVLLNCIIVSFVTLISRRKNVVAMILLFTVMGSFFVPNELVESKYIFMYTCFAMSYVFNMMTGKSFTVKKAMGMMWLVVAVVIALCAVLYGREMFIYTNETNILKDGELNRVVLNNDIERYALSIMASVAFMSLVAWHEKLTERMKNVMCTMSRYSLGIYCVSTLLLTIYYKALGNLGINISHNYIYPVLLSIVIVYVSYSILAFCEKRRWLNVFFLGGR